MTYKFKDNYIEKLKELGYNILMENMKAICQN